MSGKERIIDVIHVGEYPVYEIAEKEEGGDIIIRYAQNPAESITLVRSAIPALIRTLDRIKV